MIETGGFSKYRRKSSRLDRRRNKKRRSVVSVTQTGAIAKLPAGRHLALALSLPVRAGLAMGAPRARLSRQPSLRLSLLSLLGVAARIACIPERRGVGAGGMATAPPMREEDYCTVLVAALRPTTAAAASTLDQQVVAPPQLTSAGAGARQLSGITWHVPQHLGLETFLTSTGPPEISRYNFLLDKRKLKPELACRQAYEPGGGYSAADTLVLTDLGKEKLQGQPTLQVYRERWRCSGCSKHGQSDPNCLRVCGGFGLCVEGCEEGGKAGHACSFGFVITATLEDVANNRRLITLQSAPRRIPATAPLAQADRVLVGSYHACTMLAPCSHHACSDHACSYM